MKTVIEIAKAMKIPIHRIYDEIRAGRVESAKKGKRVYVTEKGLKDFTRRETEKLIFTPLREYLKKTGMSVAEYYRRKYMGFEIHGIKKIGGRYYVKENE